MIAFKSALTRATLTATAVFLAIALAGTVADVAHGQTITPGGGGSGGSGTVTSVACPSATITTSGTCNPLASAGTSGDVITGNGASGVQDSGTLLSSLATRGVPANLTLTNPASAATFTLLGGKTFTANNSLTLAGTDATTMTFPTTSATIARSDAAQTFTGVQTLTNGALATASGYSVFGSATTPVVTGLGYISTGATGVLLQVPNSSAAAVISADNILLESQNNTQARLILKGATSYLAWTADTSYSTPTAMIGTQDTFISRRAAANPNIGASDAAAPVAQTLSVQSVVAGTSNVGGANWTLTGSLSTGSGTSGGIVFQTGGTGAGATVQNSAVNALVIKGATQVLQLPAITSDAGLTDASVCEDTTLHGLYAGSGTLGICLGTSSARYKHDIEPLDPGLDAVMALQPISYYLNADHGDPHHQLYGFTAEQMQPVLPALVGLDAAGKPNTADYVGLIPVLVKAIQQQQTEIEALEKQVANENEIEPAALRAFTGN